MQISTTKLPMQTMAPKAAAPAAQPESAEAKAPADSFSFGDKPGHYSGPGIMGRAVGGALTGLAANYFGDGSIGGTAKLGAAVNGGVGVVVGGGIGALGGGLVGGGGGAVAGAAIGAAGMGIPMAVGGAIKGALISVVGNALGGGALAYAGSGAILGAVGL